MRTLTRQLFGRTPREFANPKRRVVESFEELIALIDQYNKRTKCYVTLYPFATEERTYADVVINKALFDFDDAWDDLVRLHRWLDERDVAHFCVFSGSDRSGHVYILTEPTRHQQSLEYFQEDIVVSRAGLRTCQACSNPVKKTDPDRIASWYCPACEENKPEHGTDPIVDTNLVGNPAAHVRVPNTWHTDAERYCVPLKPEEVTKDVEAVYELSKSQRHLELADIVSGSKTPKIDQRAGKAEELYRSYEERKLPGMSSDALALDGMEVEVEADEMMDDIECTCVRRLVTDPQDRRTMPPLGHHRRRVLISYLCNELGYNPAEVNNFMLWAVDEEKAHHSIEDEEQAVRIYRDGVLPPNKNTLKRDGLWRADCPVHGAGKAAVGAES